MLKLYIYGYLNQVPSSRKLERECGRNLELIWLMGRLKPDFKTIADFRRDNGHAIRKVCRQFIALCRDIDPLDASLVAIESSKFKAVNAKAKSYTREKLKRRLDEIDAAIDRYMGELDRADEVLDKTGMHPVETRLSRVIKKLAYYCKEARKLRAIEHRMDCRASPKRSVFTQAPEEGDIGAAQSHGHRWQSMTTAALHIADHESVTFRATLKACRLQDFGAQRPSISLASTRWASSARSGYASLIAAAAFMELAAL